MAILLRSPFKIIKKSVQNSSVLSVASPKFTDIFGNKEGDTSHIALIENLETVPQLFSVLEFLTKRITRIPIKVVSSKGKDKPDSELWNLIKSPNNYQSFNELIKLDTVYYEITGNSFMYGIKPDGMKQVTQLWELPVDKTQIILKYEHSLPAWMNEVLLYQSTIGGKIYNLSAEMVLHERYFSLRYDNGAWAWGISKYVPGSKINTELKAIHDAKTSIITQRGALGFITNESENPDPEQSKLALDKLKDASGYGLGSDQDKIILSTEKLRWQQMALGIQELQLIENAKYSMAQLCEINGFDPVIFSTEGSTFANKREAIRSAMFDVIVPMVNNRYESLSEFLSEGYGGDRIEADWSQVEEIQEDRKSLTDILIKQIEYSVITPRKANEELYGDIGLPDDKLPPDEYMRSTRLVPVVDTNQGVQVDPVTGLPVAPSKSPTDQTPAKPLTAADIQALFDANSNQNGN